MQLGDAEAIGIEHDHHGRVRDVNADFDHGGGDEHVEFLGTKLAHHLVFLRRRHAPVQETNLESLQHVTGEFRMDLLG